MSLYVQPIVEGETEVECAAPLLKRIWNELLGQSEFPLVVEPYRNRSSNFILRNDARLVEVAADALAKLQQAARHDSEARSLLLLLLDADGGDVSVLQPRLLGTMRAALPVEIDCAAVLAQKKFENWIVAGASALSGINGLPDILPARSKFEHINGEKWLDDALRAKRRNRSYKKSVDAKKFVAKMDVAEARQNSPTFDHLCRELELRILTLPTGDQSPAADPSI